MTVSPASSPPLPPAVQGLPLVIWLPGQVHGPCLRGLRQQVLSGLRQHDVVVLECSQVQELSPAGQAVLLAALRTARRHGTGLRFQQPSPAMVAALRSTGLRHLLSSQPTHR